MNEAVFNVRLQAIESAFRHLTEMRLELEQEGVWKPGRHYDRDSDFYQFFLGLSCRLSQLYLDKEEDHEEKQNTAIRHRAPGTP